MKRGSGGDACLISNAYYVQYATQCCVYIIHQESTQMSCQEVNYSPPLYQLSYRRENYGNNVWEGALKATYKAQDKYYFLRFILPPQNTHYPCWAIVTPSVQRAGRSSHCSSFRCCGVRFCHPPLVIPLVLSLSPEPASPKV